MEQTIAKEAYMENLHEADLENLQKDINRLNNAINHYKKAKKKDNYNALIANLYSIKVWAHGVSAGAANISRYLVMKYPEKYVAYLEHASECFEKKYGVTLKNR